MTLTKKEQELLMFMGKDRHFSVSPNGQKIYQSSWFFDVISSLKKRGLVRSFKQGNGRKYQLTDEGVLISYLLAKMSGKEHREIFYSIFW